MSEDWKRQYFLVLGVIVGAGIILLLRWLCEG